MIISPDFYLIVEETGEYIWTLDRVKEAWRKTHQAYEAALKYGMFKKVVLLVGIPASGKSTWLRSHEEPDTIYVDATFTTRTSRYPFVGLAGEKGIPIEAVVMDTPIAVCMDRNSCRPENRRVPEDRLVFMATKLQGDMPTTAEGFSKIIHVRDSSEKTSALMDDYKYRKPWSYMAPHANAAWIDRFQQLSESENEATNPVDGLEALAYDMGHQGQPLPPASHWMMQLGKQLRVDVKKLWAEGKEDGGGKKAALTLPELAKRMLPILDDFSRDMRRGDSDRTKIDQGGKVLTGAFMLNDRFEDRDEAGHAEASKASKKYEDLLGKRLSAFSDNIERIRVDYESDGWFYFGVTLREPERGRKAMAASSSIPQAVKDEIDALLKKYDGKPVPDSEIHAIAEDAGVPTDDVESYIYGLASAHLNEKKATSLPPTSDYEKIEEWPPMGDDRYEIWRKKRTREYIIFPKGEGWDRVYRSYSSPLKARAAIEHNINFLNPKVPEKPKAPFSAMDARELKKWVLFWASYDDAFYMDGETGMSPDRLVQYHMKDWLHLPPSAQERLMEQLEKNRKRVGKPLSYFKTAEWKDKVPGGRADKRKPEDFDQKELAKGIEVEKEHTDDPALAREIAMDHLTEFKDYYKALAKMEKGLEEKTARVAGRWLHRIGF